MLHSLLLLGAIFVSRAAQVVPCISNEKGNSGSASGIGSGWCCPAQTFTAVHTGPLERIDTRVSGGSCQAKLSIREGQWGSSEIGESLVSTGTTGPTVFTFDPPLQVEAGKVYTIYPQVVSGSCSWKYYQSDDVDGAVAGGFCPAGGCSPHVKEYAFTVYCPSGETSAPALPPCAERAGTTNTIASTYGLGSSSTYSLQGGYRFVQEFRATDTGLPSELGIYMGNNQNTYNCQLRILTLDGTVLLDHSFTGRKQRYSDWATTFPLAGLWNSGIQLQAGTWYKFDIVTSTNVGIRPILSDGADYNLFNIPGYGNIAAKFFLNGNPCATCAAVKVYDGASSTVVEGEPVTSGTVSTGPLPLERVPGALVGGSVHVPSLPVAGSSKISLTCCGDSECTFAVSIYRCAPCDSKDGGLTQTLSRASGWTGSSCAPTFGGSDRHPMTIFRKTFSAGEKEDLTLTDDVSFIAIFMSEGSLPSEWCPKNQGPNPLTGNVCSTKCA